MIRTLVVDDEPLARARLRRLVSVEPDIEIAGECADGASALATLAKTPVDLLVLDVEMPVADGLTVASAARDVAIIFVTAHEHYARHAFDVEAIDYLMKPVDPRRLAEALNRVRRRIKPTRIAARTGNRIRFVDTDDIDWIEAQGNYVALHAGGRVELIRDTLSSIEKRLDALAGSPQDVGSMLRALFLRLGPDQRGPCTFNTCWEGSGPPADCWLVSGPDLHRTPRPGLVLVHARPAEPEPSRVATRGQPPALPPEPAPPPPSPPQRSWLGDLMRRLWPWQPSADCPSCLARLGRDLSVCPRCQEPLPPRYEDLCARARLFPLQVLGYTAHGKTVFLYALTQTLDRLSVVWPRFFSQPLTQRSLEFLRSLRSRYAEGVLPEATTVARQDLYLLLLDNLERWQPCLLSLRDAAGELFRGLSFPTEALPFLLHAPVVFLLISRPDLAGSPLAMDELLAGYLHTLASHGIDIRRSPRKAVVVLTKGDRMTDLPEPLRQYLRNDPVPELLRRRKGTWDAGCLAGYLEEMARADGLIRDWVGRDAAGSRLLGLAEKHNIDLRFSLISALGLESEGRQPAAGPEPYRVLDPFFWGLELLRG